MLLPEVENFLSELTYFWLFDEVSRHSFENLCLKPTEWPQCRAKDVLLDFTRDNSKLSQSAVKKVFLQLNLWSPSSKRLVPKDQKDLAEAYHHYLTLQKKYDAGWAITQSPQNFEEIINSVNSIQKKSPGYFNCKDEIENTLLAIEEKVKAGTLSETIPGWEKLSDLIGGFNPGRASILLAQTGYGKTTFSLNLAIACARKARTMYVNMEMLKEDIMTRIIMSQTSTSFVELKTGRAPHISFTKEKMGDLDLIISEGKDKSIDEIRRDARRINHDNPVKYIFVDYDQKLILEHKKTQPEWMLMRDAVVSLEAMAKELNAYVMLMAQASDEDGKISSSKRALFPCSTVLFFHKQDGVDQIEVKKNRFGPLDKILTINYDRARAKIIEKEVIDKPGVENGNTKTRSDERRGNYDLLAGVPNRFTERRTTPYKD